MNTKRLMCLDIGEKRIGIAVSDLLMITAQGVETYNRKENDLQADINYILEMAKKQNAYKIVCGLPKNMNGSIGMQAEKSLEFGNILKEKGEYEVVFFDERLSTASAKRTLLEADTSRKKRKKVIDKVAAVYILQAYMDSGAERKL